MRSLLLLALALPASGFAPRLAASSFRAGARRPAPANALADDFEEAYKAGAIPDAGKAAPEAEAEAAAAAAPAEASTGESIVVLGPPEDNVVAIHDDLVDAYAAAQIPEEAKMAAASSPVLTEPTAAVEEAAAVVEEPAAVAEEPAAAAAPAEASTGESIVVLGPPEDNVVAIHDDLVDAYAAAQIPEEAKMAAASSPVLTEPTAAVEEAAAVAEEPEPIVEEAKAVAEEPEPVIEEPEPVVEEPEAVVEVPEPVVEEPKAAAEEPKAAASAGAAAEEDDVMKALRGRVQEDASERAARREAVQDLSAQLQQSLKRKAEAESVLVEEVAALRQRLFLEIQNDLQRANTIGSLLSEVESAILEKTATIAKEEDILVELERVRESVTEEIVLVQLEAACGKKAELIGIETSLLADLKEIEQQLAEDARGSAAVLTSLQEAFEGMPDRDDAEAARLFGWNSIAALQQQLLEAAAASVARESHVEGLRERLEVAERRRNAALGVAVEEDSGRFKKTSAAFGSAQRAAEMSDRRRSKLSVLQERKEEQDGGKLLGTALEAAVGGTGAFVSASGSALRVTQDLIESRGVEKAGAAAGKTSEAVGGFFGGLRRAAQAAGRAWSEGTTEGKDINSIDQLLSSLLSGAKNVRKSDDVKDALGSARDNIGAAGRGAKDVTGGIADALQEVSAASSTQSFRSATTDLLSFTSAAIDALRRAGMSFASKQKLLPAGKDLPPTPKKAKEAREGAEDAA